MNKKDKEFLTKLADLMDEYDAQIEADARDIEIYWPDGEIIFSETTVVDGKEIREAIGDDL